VPSSSSEPQPDEMFQAFVHELAMSPERAGLLEGLTSGHQADKYGWCSHPGHTYHWERHPCFNLRLAGFVDADVPEV
jgi:hypothetical protein